jgi:hypothetical protein
MRKTRAQKQMARRREREAAPIVVPPSTPKVTIVAVPIDPREPAHYEDPIVDVDTIYRNQGFRKLRGTDYAAGSYEGDRPYRPASTEARDRQ